MYMSNTVDKLDVPATYTSFSGSDAIPFVKTLDGTVYDLKNVGNVKYSVEYGYFGVNKVAGTFNAYIFDGGIFLHSIIRKGVVELWMEMKNEYGGRILMHFVKPKILKMEGVIDKDSIIMQDVYSFEADDIKYERVAQEVGSRNG